MNGQLQSGAVLTSQAQVCYTVISLLGSGGQGEVYDIEAGGTHKALKWYFPQNAHPRQWEILERLVEIGPPDSEFLWPEDLVVAQDGKTFGYIMPLRPKKYKSLVDLLKFRVTPTFYARCRTAYNLASAYDKLHTRGDCYRDINYGNLFFDPDTGDVLICDNDNVAPKDMQGLVKGTLGFMAPEIVRGEAQPSRYTDQFSLAVLLFHLFMIAHPFHGKLEDNIKCFDLPAQTWLYGKNPVFIFDPENSSNRPVPGNHDNAIIYWGLYPQELKDLFIESFTVGLSSPHKRVTERRWMDVIANMMTCIAPCPQCGAQVFYDSQKADAGLAHTCWRCHSTFYMPSVLAVGKHRVLMRNEAEIPAHQLDGSYDMETIVGRVVPHPQKPNILGIRNEGKGNWTCIDPDGSQTPVAPGKSVTVNKDIKIDFGMKTGEFK